MSFDMEDWVVEAASPGESESCLCSEPSSETNGHNQSIYAWDTAMKQASQLTSIPPPWEEDPQCGFTNTNDTYDAEPPLLSAEELFASDDVSTPFPPSIPAPILPSTSASDQQAAAAAATATAKIHTDPDQISSARRAAVQRNCTVRKAKLRNAHLDRITRLKAKKSQSIADVIDVQTINDDACGGGGGGLQTPAPADMHDTIPSSPPYLTPTQDDLIAAASDADFEIGFSDTLQDVVYSTPAPALPTSHDPTNQISIPLPPLPTHAPNTTTTPPPYTYPQLIKLALLSSPRTPLSSVQIRNWILDTFAYYRYADVPWRGGVNACLGAGEGFVRVDGEGGGDGSEERWRVAE